MICFIKINDRECHARKERALGISPINMCMNERVSRASLHSMVSALIVYTRAFEFRWSCPSGRYNLEFIALSSSWCQWLEAEAAKEKGHAYEIWIFKPGCLWPNFKEFPLHRLDPCLFWMSLRVLTLFRKGEKIFFSPLAHLMSSKVIQHLQHNV